MTKEGRIQFRMDFEDKKWFERYAKKRGGMSRLLVEFICALKKQEQPAHVNGHSTQPEAI